MIRIREVTNATEDVLEQLNVLIPQLSKSANPLTFDELEKIISSSATHLYIAEEDNNVLGMLSLVIFPIPTGLRSWVEDVVVDAQARGRGLGKMLTHHALSEAKKYGALTVDLTSRPNRETANKLYQSAGFETVQPMYTAINMRSD